MDMGGDKAAKELKRAIEQSPRLIAWGWDMTADAIRLLDRDAEKHPHNPAYNPMIFAVPTRKGEIDVIEDEAARAGISGVLYVMQLLNLVGRSKELRDWVHQTIQFDKAQIHRTETLQ